jgi:hypothetical protein
MFGPRPPPAPRPASPAVGRSASAQNQRRLARDFAQRLGVFDSALDNLFGPQGPWTPEEEILP